MFGWHCRRTLCNSGNEPGGLPGLFSIAGGCKQGGFTVVELIVTIVIIGILAAVVVPRFSGTHGFEERGFRDETAAALRYAQKTAVASHRRVCVTFSADGVTATMDSSFGAADCSVVVLGPTGAALAVTVPAGVSFSPTPAALTFDPAGRPNGRAVITVSGLAGLPITIEAETGYVR